MNYKEISPDTLVLKTEKDGYDAWMIKFLSNCAIFVHKLKIIILATLKHNNYQLALISANNFACRTEALLH